MTVSVQSLWFKTDKWQEADAHTWAEDHDFKHDLTRYRDEGGEKTHIIFPQFDTSEAKENSWRTISDTFPDGISASTCERKTMEVKYTQEPSGLETKSHLSAADLDKGVTFVVSSGSYDRVKDRVFPKGLVNEKEFAQNSPALLGHDHLNLCGTWKNLRREGNKVLADLMLAAKGTSPLVDSVRALVQQKILKASSIGFIPHEYEPNEKGGMDYTRWSLSEISLVSVPCNQDALSMAKSLGASPDLLKTLFTEEVTPGQNAAPVTKSENNQTGTPLAKPNLKTSNVEKKAMSIEKKVQAKQERVVAIRDELTELKCIAEAEDFQGFSDDQEDTIGLLNDEMESTIKSIESLAKLEATIAAKAQPVQQAAPRMTTGGAFPVEEKGGDLLFKSMAVKLTSHMRQISDEQAMSQLGYDHDDRIKAAHDHITKSAVMPASTTDSTWASALVRNSIEGFMTDLEPVSVYAALRARSGALDFGTANSITIPRRSAKDRGLVPSWVGEGGVIPVGKASFGSQTMNRYKVAVISAFSNEIMQQSTPNIESLIRQAILDDTAYQLDAALLDGSAAVSGVRPASILAGVTGTASVGATASDIITDLKVLIGSMQTANLGAAPCILMNSARLLGLATVTNATGQFMWRDEVASGRLMGIPVITSSNVPADQVIIVDSNSFVAANASPEFMVSDQAALTMADAGAAAPSQAGDAADYTGGGLGDAGQVPPKGGIILSGDGTGSPTGASVSNYQALSMYQTFQTSIRMILPASFALTRPGAVDQITGAAW